MARVPHHLIDIADPNEVWSLAIFQRAAHNIIRGIHGRRKLPLLVGGTGQYVRAVVEGWDLPEQQPDHRLRTALEKWGQEIGAKNLHQCLVVLDPAAASAIQFQNMRRTIRALEVIFRTGRRFSDQRQRSKPPYSFITIGLIRPRAELYTRIDQRIEDMVAKGLLEEVSGLLARGYAADLPSMSAIGYREMILHLRGEITLDEAIIRIKRATRQFVRRQANWFKLDDPNIHWFSVDSHTLDAVERLIMSDETWRGAGGEGHG